MFGKKKPVVIETKEEAREREQAAREALMTTPSMDKPTIESKPANDRTINTNRSLLKKIKQNTALSIMIIVLILVLVSVGAWFAWNKIRESQLAKQQKEEEDKSQSITKTAIYGNLSKEDQLECDQASAVSENLGKECIAKKRVERVDEALKNNSDKITDKDKERLLISKMTDLVGDYSEADVDAIASELNSINANYYAYIDLSAKYNYINWQKAIDYMKKAYSIYETKPDKNEIEDDYDAEDFNRIIKELEQYRDR